MINKYLNKYTYNVKLYFLENIKNIDCIDSIDKNNIDIVINDFASDFMDFIDNTNKKLEYIYKKETIKANGNEVLLNTINQSNFDYNIQMLNDKGNMYNQIGLNLENILKFNIK